MTQAGDNHGIALWCDVNGGVLEVLRDEFGLDRLRESGVSFRTFCDPMSRRKFDRLLAKVRQDHAVYDWPLNLNVHQEVRTLHVAAGKYSDRILLIGVENPGMRDTLYEELIRISGEQATALRTALKTLSRCEGRTSANPGLADGSPDLAAFTRLNNELVSVQRELAKRNIELERVSRDKDRFVGMAAHDLRQPLRAIISMTELLMLGSFGSLESRQEQIVDTIRTSSESMLELVNDLLDVSVIESGKLELRYQPTDVAALLASLEGTYGELARSKEIELKIACVDELPEDAWLDENRMAQVLGNLVSNAIKYSHSHTRVRVSARLEGELLRIEVADQGQGIPSDELEHLFKPFAKTSVRTTAGESSTGLGLAICERVIREHGGHISIESEVDKGSTFRIEVPWRAPVAKTRTSE